MILKTVSSENGKFLRGTHVSLFENLPDLRGVDRGVAYERKRISGCSLSCLALFTPGPLTRFQCYMHRRHLRSSFDMPSKRLKDR